MPRTSTIFAASAETTLLEIRWQGLRDLMMDNRQGVLAQVIRSGRIKIGDRIKVAKVSEPD